MILVIDDSESVRIVIREFLEKNGYPTLEADSGETGIDILCKEDINLIVCDYVMPKMDGLRFYKKIKVMNKPFILLTSYVESIDDLKIEDDPLLKIVTKPPDLKKLLRIVEFFFKLDRNDLIKSPKHLKKGA